MNLDELRSVQNRERQTDSLQHLRESFYEEVGRYISDLKTERERAAEAADDPWSDPEVQRLTDEIETAEEVAESIYERRMGKLVKSASLAAGGYTTDAEGLTVEEERLFEDLVDRIETNKSTVLDVLTGDAVEAAVDRSAESEGTPDQRAAEQSEPTAAESGHGHHTEGVDAASVMGADGPEQTDPVVADSSEQTDPVVADSSDPSGSVTADGAASAEPGAGTASAEPDAGTAPADDPLVDDVEPGASSGVPDPPSDAPVDPVSPDVRSDTGSDDTVGTDGAGSSGTPGSVNAGSTASGSPGSAATESPTTDPKGDGATGGGFDDRRTVRITRDVGAILGVDDHEYDLTEQDVVTLPEENADPLIERDAAEPID